MKKQETEEFEKNIDQTTRERFWEIDFFRGLAVFLMLGLHFLDDLYYFYGYQVGLNLVVWYLWQRVTACIFLLLVGISLTLKYRMLTVEAAERSLFKKLFQRGGLIFGWGIVITIVTRMFLTEGFIIFGILHLIGISMMMSYPFLNLSYWNLLLGIICIGFGIFLNNLRFTFSWLLWAGFVPENYFTVDYFPVFPWFGVVLLGIFVGKILYGGNKRKFPLKDLTRWKFVKWFCLIGKCSLTIYLVHQPVFIFLLYLIGNKS